MMNFIAGTFVGTFVGMLITSLCVMSGRNNDQWEKINSNKESEQINNKEV